MLCIISNNQSVWFHIWMLFKNFPNLLSKLLACFYSYICFIWIFPWRLKLSSTRHCPLGISTQPGNRFKMMIELPFTSSNIDSLLQMLVRTTVTCHLWVRQAILQRTVIGRTYLALIRVSEVCTKFVHPAYKTPKKCFQIIGWAPEFYVVWFDTNFLPEKWCENFSQSCN